MLKAQRTPLFNRHLRPYRALPTAEVQIVTYQKSHSTGRILSEQDLKAPTDLERLPGFRRDRGLFLAD